ncbi:MAG: cupin domain-containing protein [Chloroflexota bacterium]|nr:cupin domain-containing protein [Chloroflexota bacterium]
MVDGYFVTPNDARQVEMRPGVHRRTMGTTDEVMLCEFLLQREANVQPHSHINDQVGYVVYGRIAFTVGDETRILQPGDSYAVPGGIVHSSRAEIDTLLVEVFSPPRDEYRRVPTEDGQ